MPQTISPANQAALARILACVPVWSGVASARDVVGLPDRTLLHAGPPLADPTRPPPPMLNSAVLACMHEGWASDEAAAEALISTGTVRLEPGLSWRVSTPLVSMVGPRTTLAVIHDTNAPERRWFGFLGTGGGAQMRFGARDRAILDRLAFRERELLAGFTELLAAGPAEHAEVERQRVGAAGAGLDRRVEAEHEHRHGDQVGQRADDERARPADARQRAGGGGERRHEAVGTDAALAEWRDGGGRQRFDDDVVEPAEVRHA